MTAPARITQADMDRSVKVAKNLDTDRYTIRMDFPNGTIDIIVGEAPDKTRQRGNPLDRLLGPNAS